MYSKEYRQDERETDLNRETVSWQRHTFYFSAKEARLDFEIGAIVPTWEFILTTFLYDTSEKYLTIVLQHTCLLMSYIFISGAPYTQRGVLLRTLVQ